MADVLTETVKENRATGKTSHKCCAAALCTYVLIGRITEKTSRSMHIQKILVVGWKGQENETI